MPKGQKAPNFEGFNITEREIRYAMENSTSNLDAARFLRITLPTYKKYARLYLDPTTGLNLYELHKKNHPIALNRNKIRTKWFKKGKELMDAILRGDLQPPPTYQFKYFLIREGILEERCDCGFKERRITDGSVPLLLIYLDGDKTNGKRENIRFMCYNCYYLQIGNIWGRPVKPKFDIPEEFEWT